MIVVGGEALIDLILHQDGRVSAVPGGGPFNTARTIGRLGLSVGFVGSLSTDRFGTLLHDRLVTDGVIDDLTLRTDAPTTLAVAELDDAGGASYRFYTAATSAVALDAGQLPAFGSVGGRPLTPTAIHVGTLGLVLDGLAGAMEALVAGASDDAVVMVDPNARPAATSDRGAWLGRLSRVLRRADIVKVSTDDLAWMRPTADPDRAAMGFLDDGPSVVLWTDGDHGVRIITRRGSTRVPAPRVKVVDTVGAGDAFGGGFLAAWIGAGRGRAGLDDDEGLIAAARHGVRVAAFTCTRAGAEPPTATELATWGSDR